MQNITKRLALFAASAGVALAGLGVLATVANAATDLPPGPGLSLAAYPPGPSLSVADLPPGPGVVRKEI